MRFSHLLLAATIAVLGSGNAMAQGCAELLPQAKHNMAWQWENSGGEHDREMDTFQYYFYGTTQRNLVIGWVFSAVRLIAAGDPGGFIDEYFPNFKKSPESAFNAIRNGQSHNRGVQELYDATKMACGTEAFVLHWVASSYSPCDLNDVAYNVDWQIDNNPISVANAYHWWTYGRNNSNNDAKIAAMWSLLSGQRHNNGPLNVYRQCFNVNGNNLFDTVYNKLVAKNGFVKAAEEAERLRQQEVDRNEARAAAHAARMGL